MNKLTLPIDKYTEKILNSVRDYSTVIIKASPGSGKTTRLPWAIAKSLNAKVAVLEPRRLAAKLAALRIAEEEQLTLGKEVGYHFRFEKTCEDETLVTFLTEGTFLKKFITDPDLSQYDVIILDEFHERHLETDLALAYLRRLQERRKIKIVLMSATIDTKLLDGIKDSFAIEIEAPHFPVEITYLENQPSILNQSLEAKIKKAVALSPAGDILVFVPGMREMLRVQDALSGENVLLLHADLSKEEQSRALSPSQKRKIILATNIAESSVTIPGITVVIDSGIQREAHYSPWNGLKHIQDSPITKASAIQRTGRAGRTGPGVCHRLYSQQDFNEREDHTIPEIERADLTDIYLFVEKTGVSPLWIENPPKEKWDLSRSLLEKIGAIDSSGITDIGKKILNYPLSTRSARILVAGENLTTRNKETLLRYVCDEIEEDRTGTLKRKLQHYLKNSGNDNSPWEKCVLTGFIDQVARFRSKQRDFIHYSGKTLKAHHSLHDLQDGLYILFDITQRQEAIKVLSIDDEWPWDIIPFPFTEEDEVQIDESITIRSKTKLGSLVIEESIKKPSWDSLNPETRNKILKLSEAKLKNKISLWKESPEFERIAYWCKQKNLSLDILESFPLEKYFEACESLNWEQLHYFIKELLESTLDFTNFERELPLKINLGGRRELTVYYPLNQDPYLEAPMQDFYGQLSTPTIMNGKIPLTLKLVGPHKRPIQITKDLTNFWQKTYQEMKKEYQRDYPRHYWPDKPWEAKPFLLKSHLPKA